MAWQQNFLEAFGTGVLGGTSFRTYFKILRDNRFSIDPPFYLRAAVTAFSSLQNSAQRRVEDWVYGDAVRKTEIHPPIFVLGLWRSGTTHLHNLLCCDWRFAFPNTYQVFFPHSFLTTERFNSRMLNWLLPSRRVQDNVEIGAKLPQEDDFAIAGLTGMSFNLSIAFPRRAEAYTKFLTFQRATASEKRIWAEALEHFLKKLTFKYHRPIVLKSPAHTGHVRELVRLFPDAKFVLIHRDPVEVYSSTVHCLETVFKMWALQRLGTHSIAESTIQNVREVTESYFADRQHIPPGQLTEIAFTELEQRPIETMARIYRELDLPAFRFTQQTMQNHLDSLGEYKKNRHHEVDPETRARLGEQWQQYFTNWGYGETAAARAA